MKKYIIGIITATFIFTGCSSKAPNQQFECKIENQKAPSWICMPQDTKEYIVAVGSAKKNIANDFQLQREEAMASARDALARRIATKVKNLLKNYKAITGVKNNQTYEKSLEVVSRQIAYQTLKDSKQLNMWISKDGTMFVLVGVPKKALNQIETSLNNNQALYQKMIAKKAQEELNKEIKEEFKN